MTIPIAVALVLSGITMAGRSSANVVWGSPSRRPPYAEHPNRRPDGRRYLLNWRGSNMLIFIERIHVLSMPHRADSRPIDAWSSESSESDPRRGMRRSEGVEPPIHECRILLSGTTLRATMTCHTSVGSQARQRRRSGLAGRGRSASTARADPKRRLRRDPRGLRSRA
jgi:hypothetical protein